MTKHAVTPAPVVRLSGPQGMAVAVPQFLGFQPADSLVVLCLTAPRGRVGPVARVDLFDPGDGDGPIEQIVGCAVRHADAVAVLCYHDGDRPGCLDILLDALSAAGVPVTDVLAVRERRIHRADRPGDELEDPGVPLPGPDYPPARALAAASALAGRRVLPDRRALRASVAAPTGRQLVAARSEIDAVLEAEGRPESSGPLPDGDLARRVDDTFARAVAEQVERGAVSARTAARLVVLAGDVACRDRLVAHAVRGDDPDVVALLIAVVTRCPDDAVPGIGAVLAVAAYRYGDGALAQCAVDRVLAVEPAHRLAHLLLAAMAGSLPPDELAGMAELLEQDHRPS